METLGVMAILATVCLAFVALTGLTIGLAILGQRLFAHAGGLVRLAERYPAEHEPVGETFKLQSVQIGPVRWRFCTRVVVAEEGLYVAVRNTVQMHIARAIAPHLAPGLDPES